MHQWQHSPSISIPWWIVGLAGVATFLIALGTVSFQSARAARTNPMRSLRTE